MNPVHCMQTHKNVDKAHSCKLPYTLEKSHGKEVVLFVPNRTTNINFLEDGVQISLILVTKKDGMRGLCNLKLQEIKKSLIQTYTQKYMSLNVGLHWVFTHSFIINKYNL